MKGLRFPIVAYALVAGLLVPSPLEADDPSGGRDSPANQVAQSEGPDTGTVDDVPQLKPNAGEGINRSSVDDRARGDKDSREPKGGRPRARASASRTISMRDNEFDPKTFTVAQNTRVTWENVGQNGHNVVSKTGGFRLTGTENDTVDPGDSVSVTLTKTGTFAYYCEPHRNLGMKGTFTVTAATSGGGGGGGTGGPSTDTTATGGVEDEGDTASSGSGSDSSSNTGGSDSRSDLANTGLDVALLAGFGLAFLGLGVLLRRRVAEQ